MCSYFKIPWYEDSQWFFCDLQDDGYHTLEELYKMCPLINIDDLLNTPAQVIYEKLYNENLKRSDENDL